jgi:hypothetical protein
MRDPGDDYAAYQLEGVRIVGRRTGTLEFERWFPTTPRLDPGFGLECSETSLRGTLRPSGLTAQPLRGSPPLWPALRTVDLQYERVDPPVVRLFEATSKHHWDGWRQTTPRSWPGGRSVVLRHVGAPTVWREHEYHAVQPSGEAPVVRPKPPDGILPGIQLEVFWPEGPTLEFPETRFEADAEVVTLPLSKLPPGMTERLAQSVSQRPGWEPSSVSAQEWHELQAAVPDIESPLSIAMVPSVGDGTALRITRLHAFREAWLCVFAAAYDGDRRWILTSLLVRPERWTGPLPE